MRRFGSEKGIRTLEEGRVVVHGLLPELVFGPVDSRRLGKSLGINPFPAGEKICSFNCPYCECGWTNRLWVGVHTEVAWPSLEDIRAQLETRLARIQSASETLDAITFAGNGEPTLYPEFPALIDVTLGLRDKYAPTAKVAVLTNASELNRPEIANALRKVDETCMKLDAVSAETAGKVNKPHASLDMSEIIERIAAFPSPVIQSMFMQGPADNTGEAEIELWLEALARIRPRRVDIYSIDRTPPDPRLRKVPREMLESIAEKVRRQVGTDAFVF